MEKNNNVYATISLGLVLCNLALYFVLFSLNVSLGIIGLIIAIIALGAGILGLIGKSQIDKDQTQKGKGLAVTGIVLGFLGFTLFGLMALGVTKFGDPEFTKGLCEKEQLTTSCERTEDKTTTCLYGGTTEMTCYTEVLKEGQYK